MNQSNIIKQTKFTYYLLGKQPKTTGSKIEVINKKNSITATQIENT